MKIAVLLGSESFARDERFLELKSRLALEKGFTLERVGGTCHSAAGKSEGIGTPGYLPYSIAPDFDMLMSVGGDGTYLSAVSLTANLGIPVIGVNLGRIGFLSENEPEDVCEALLNNNYRIREMPLLSVSAEGRQYTAFNEVSVLRSDRSTIGINVALDGNALPTYWADGLLVSTPAGSTAYCLSVGGPIVHPASKVLVLSPIAPHNLNVRPFVVPQGRTISLSFKSRCGKVLVYADNTAFTVSANSSVEVTLSSLMHKRVCLPKSNYIKALSDKLFWGKDKRNERE